MILLIVFPVSAYPITENPREKEILSSFPPESGQKGMGTDQQKIIFSYDADGDLFLEHESEQAKAASAPSDFALEISCWNDEIIKSYDKGLTALYRMMGGIM